MNAEAAEAENAEKIISKHIEIREFIEREVAALDERLKPYRAALVALENGAALLAKKTGQTSLKAESGTAYASTNSRVKVEDRTVFHTFVFANQAYHFLTAHVMKEAVDDWQEQHEGRLPPGVSKETYIKWHIRRS